MNDQHNQHKETYSRLQVWPLLGPWLVTATLLVVLLKAGEPLYLPAIAVVGVPICWKWKMPGLFGLIATLLAYLVLTYSGVEMQERFWHVGTTLSVALALVVTTLALEEGEVQGSRLQVESESRLDTLNHLDDKLKKTQNSWQEDRRDLLERLQAATREVDEKRTRITTFQRVISIVRQDLDGAHEQRQDLLRDLYDKDLAVQRLEQRITEMEAVGEGDAASKVLAKERLDALNTVRVELFQQKLLVVEAQRAVKCVPVATTGGMESIGPDSDVEMKLQDNIDALYDKARQLRRAEGMYQQLREQFEEKGAVLDATRRELFHARERCLAYEHAVEESSKAELSDSELILEHYLLQSAREQQDEDTNRNEEVLALEALVGSLLKELGRGQVDTTAFMA